MTDAIPIFTAAEIAAALGRKRQNVAALLSPVPATGSKIVSGQEARGWSVSVLPQPVLRSLNEQARRNGCRDAAEYLRQSSRTWAPEVPLTECDPIAIEAAQKLREALRPSLGRQNGWLSADDFKRRGVEDYRKVFGHEITPRHFDRLFVRTLRRAGTTHDLDKLELYLPERPKRREVETVVATGSTDAGKRLASFLKVLVDPLNPTMAERESVWCEALEIHQALIEQGEPAARAGRQIRAALLQQAPWIATSAESLQKIFKTRLDRWQAAGGDASAVLDGRRRNTGNPEGYELPEADLNVLVHLGVWQFHGHLAAAWRAAHKRNLLTPETVSRYPLATAKSQVPTKIRDAVGSEIELLRRMKLHQKAASDLVPHMTRTCDALSSCQVFNADDVTLPVYCYVPNADGWFDLVRGQCLLFIDLRSLKIVGWSFQQDRNYSSLVIRTLCTRIFSELCVPKVLHFERGIWENSTLLVGKNSDSAVPFGEVVQGLKEFGIEFQNSHRPRSKPVERVIGLLQDLMEGEPGYCGRDERRDLPAHTKRAMDDVKFHRRHPSELFFSFDQWHARIAEIVATYNATPQQGRILDDISPDEAFDKFMDHEDPPLQLGPELRHLLAHHKEEREVKTSGLQFKVGKNLFRYYGPELAHLVGRRVLAWFDPENPDHLAVTDLDRKNPILVPRAVDVPAMARLTGGSEILESETARAQGQMAHLRARYNVVKGALPLPHRAVLPNRRAVQTGAQITQLREEKAQRQRNADRTRRVANALGVHVSDRLQGEEETPDKLRDMQAYLNQHLPKK
jgi:hypothetical protein